MAEKGNLLDLLRKTLELAMPDKLTAEMIKNNFIAHGSDIFPKLLNALTQPGSEDDRPPAGLM